MMLGRVLEQYDNPTASEGMNFRLDGCRYLAAKYDERLR